MKNSKPPIVQGEFTVKHKQYLTPHFIRVVLTGDVSIFKDAVLGDNNKVFIPPKGVSKLHMRYFDSDKNEWILPPKEVLPIMRTYTHRNIDLDKKELTIDFVNHGKSGPASAWAIDAKPGFEIGVAMKLNKKKLIPDANWYLLVGDATAIPVLSVILESLPSSAKGICMIEVHGKEDEQVLKTKADIEFKWFYNPNPEKGNFLIDKVQSINIPETEKFGYVACEFSSVKEIRNYLRKDLNWSSNELYAYSYWKSGISENESANERLKEKE
ncbi:siderophore-interacting protein [Polaribacter sargassicola]|uniref:siderophore-interacting protein n=1 Tax=Polaribacter sargassicola TaxID=2836891 RepID=UPI001F2AFC30|nr:siderophore-interacting protein [Polaribacter sp. DS7-9]MCG1035310.1 siderophore-interacting protein [Polaribacter sp. DS7-9]